ncbi:MAG: hypothetical protein CM15mP74_14450 [Halieaceae bacterium]|nr:MAG: hypothetical protein CM15mP74_14450 [Halieaceae bacterium]
MKVWACRWTVRRCWHTSPQGHQVEKLALEWGARVAAVVDKDLSLRRLKLATPSAKANDELVETRWLAPDPGLLILCEILAGVQADLIKAFGGIAE